MTCVKVYLCVCVCFLKSYFINIVFNSAEAGTHHIYN